MASLTGPVTVPAPNPIVPRYGLFQVATGPLDLPVNARQGGVQYQVSTCDLPNVYEVDCFEDLSEKTISGAVPTVSGAPFIVYSTIRCSPVGLANWGNEHVRKLLYDQLVAGEQAAVENAFSQSSFGLSPGLANNPSVVNLGSAANLVSAVGTLEAWLYGRYGIPGVIHAPMLAAPLFNFDHIIDLDSAGIWRTDVRTAVSFGNYANIGPSGQVPAAGDAWLYITGPVAIWRDPDKDLFSPPVGHVIDRSTNLITTVMERAYVLTFDCYIAAIQTSLEPS